MTPKTKFIMTLHWNVPNALKDYLDENKDCYVPIFAGGRKRLEQTKDKWLIKNCIADDDYEDNISPLNGLLNELTTMYVVYKNIQVVGDAANVGHVHYRRFFSKDVWSKVNTCDGIIAAPIPLRTAGFMTTVEQQYALCHFAEDFDILKQTIIDAGLMNVETWLEWTTLDFLYAPCNCHLLKREVWNMLMKDLFKIVLQLPEKINVEGRDDYQRRAIGFLSERYISYWFFTMQRIGKMNFIESPLEEHLDWKPEGATDKRGMTNGIFVGDQSLPKIYEWIAQNNKKEQN